MNVYFKDIKKLLSKCMTRKGYIKLKYFRHYKKFPNLRNPQGFGEKIQWIKLYGNIEKYQKYVDKYEVRQFVTDCIGKKYLIDCIDVYESVDKFDLSKLPDQFVLKGTHGSGYNIIVKDKKEISEESIKIQLKKWMSENFYDIGKEIQYKNIKPRFVCEKYLEDDSGELRDYKIFCFDGIPKFIQVDNGRMSNHTQDFYDLNWNKLDLEFAGKNSDICTERPKKLDTMLNLATKLSKKFPFVRVDLYYVDDKIYFGELTFTPTDGMSRFKPNFKDIEISNMINLEKYNA